MQLTDRTIKTPRKQPLVYALMGIVLLTGLQAWSSEADNGASILRSRVYKLKHLTSQQAREFFEQLNIGKSYNALTPDVLIVTSNIGTDLIKATEVIGVLDQDPPARIQTLMTASESQPLPPLNEFTAGLKSVTVGTMTEAPPKGSPNPAIIDILNDDLIIIAAEETIAEVSKQFETWKQEHPMSAAAEEKSIPEISPTPIPSISPVKEVTSKIEKDMPAEEKMPEDVPTQPSTTVESLIPQEDEVPQIQIPQAKEEKSPLQQVAEEIFNGQTTRDKDLSSVETPTEDSEEGEDFMSRELDKTLDEAQEQAQQINEEVVTESVPSETKVTAGSTDQTTAEQPSLEVRETPAEETVQEQDPLEIVKALLAQSKAEEQAAREAERQIAELETVRRKETQEEIGPLKAELQSLREKLAELESRTVLEQAPVEQPEAESKIQTKETVVTEPRLEPELAEKELETVVDLPQEVELESLVDLVGKQLGLNYMYDPLIFKNQKVQLKVHGGKIKVKDMYALLESVLRLKGFIMTRREQLVTILKADAATVAKALQQADTVIRTPDDPIQPGDIIVSTIFDLENISTSSAKNMLVQMDLGLDANKGFQEIPETNTLIVTDYAYRMSRIEEVLSMIDVPGEKKEYKFRTLKYMKPSEMVPKLQELAQELEGVSLEISTPSAPEQATRTVKTRDPKTGQIVERQVPIRTPSRTTTPVAKEPAKQADTVFIDTDDRTNRILMAGKPDQVALVNELIDALDVPQYDLKFVREYIIENVEAQDIVDVLNELGLANVSVTSQETATRTRTRTRTPAQQAQQAQQAAQQARSAQAEGAEQPYISIRPATNSLLVNATAEQHQAIELVIAHVDVVQKDQRTIRQYEIQYVDAQEIIDTLVDLQIISPESAATTTSDRGRQTTSRSGRARQATGRSPQAQADVVEEAAVPVSLPTAEGGSEKEITADQPQISILETTNSLLVFATPRQHDAIALVIAHADRETPSTNTPYVVYALENQDPVELEGILTKLIQETVEQVGKTSTPESKIQTGGGTSALTNLPTLEEQNIRVIADPMSYSLIVYANKRNQQWISELIKELDAYRPQVLLDVTLVEITKQDDFNFDLNVLHSIPDLTYTSGLTGAITKDSDGNPLITKNDILDKLLNPASDRSRFIDMQSDSGSFTGFYGNDKVMALFTAMQTKDYGRILAKPKLLVDDNQEGSIETKTTTYITRTTSSFQNTESGDPIQTTNTEFEPYDATINMSIKPHISKGNNLRLEITLNRSDFLNFDANSEKPPDQAVSDVGTVVTVPDDSTIILGGMDRINQGKGGTKVPILGDIPLLGGLFRSTSNTNAQSKLYVFVKAHILRPGDDMSSQDLKNISNKFKIEFEKEEAEMQAYDDWPGVKPKPMDPVKVLGDNEEEISMNDEK